MRVWRLLTEMVSERIGYSSEEGSTLPASPLARGDQRENEAENLVGWKRHPRESINWKGVDS